MSQEAETRNVDKNAGSSEDSDCGSDSSSVIARRPISAPMRALKIAVSAAALFLVVKLFRRMRNGNGEGEPISLATIMENLESVWEYLVEGAQDHLSTRIFCLAITLLMKLLPKKRRYLLEWLLD